MQRLRLYRGKWAIVWTEAGRTRRQSLGTSDRAAAEIAFRDYQSRIRSAGMSRTCAKARTSRNPHDIRAARNRFGSNLIRYPHCLCGF